MQQYYKTQLGIDALKNRTLDLNARQRRLLLLIGTEDFLRMNDLIKRSLAPLEILSQLKNMGLIDYDPTHPLYTLEHNQNISEIDLDIDIQRKNIEAVIINTQLHSTNTITQIPHTHFIPNSTEVLTTLTFDEIKQVMHTLLQQHCGLMAKQLINRINATQTLSDLKLCQMQWITVLQESRISPIELNKTMQHINQSIQQLNLS
ncbi:hypothetical protein [Acinetobacter silvestris]|uniref:Uncharacterized protein n=1 Tax=Acinetobacter silvestris TaxID=1977882 RepID=A0A1Y3CJI6_9GAMM|nr:hypothetical protein [Acinetobacter silvestris]OTG65786.1 hypothetical protein B9T28_06180 [Acinetobacter silvestris]